MTDARQSTQASDWAASRGDVWARRWRDTDAALHALSQALLSAIAAGSPSGRFKAFEIGCGPGSTTIAVADRCPQATITACDISPTLAAIAGQRTADRANVRIVTGDAEVVGPSEGPFDLFFSRHGVMFFSDPLRAFGALRTAANASASLVFSCFRSWDLNPWASQLASAAAGRELPKPGREPGGFAFADPDYVRQILESSGWIAAEPVEIAFEYCAGHGVDEALSFLCEIGPASRITETMDEADRPAAIERMRAVIEAHLEGSDVVFQAAAWIWRAKANRGG